MYPTVVAMCSDWDQPKVIGTFDNNVDATKVAAKINQTVYIQAWVVEPKHNPVIDEPVNVFTCRISNKKFDEPFFSSYKTIPALEDDPEPPYIEQCGEGSWLLWAFSEDKLKANLQKLREQIELAR